MPRIAGVRGNSSDGSSIPIRWGNRVMNRCRSLTPNEVKYLKQAFSQFTRSLRVVFWVLLLTCVIFDVFFLWVLPKLYPDQQGLFSLVFLGFNVFFVGLLFFVRRRFLKDPDPTRDVITISGKFSSKEVDVPGSRYRIETDIYFIGDNPVSLPVGWSDYLEPGQNAVAEVYPIPLKKFDRRFSGGPLHYFVLNLNKPYAIDGEIGRGLLHFKNNSLNMLLFLVFITTYFTVGFLMYRDYGVHPTAALYHYVKGNVVSDVTHEDGGNVIPLPSNRYTKVFKDNGHLIIFVHVALLLGILFLIRLWLTEKRNAALLKQVRGPRSKGVP